MKYKHYFAFKGIVTLDTSLEGLNNLNKVKDIFREISGVDIEFKTENPIEILGMAVETDRPKRPNLDVFKVPEVFDPIYKTFKEHGFIVSGLDIYFVRTEEVLNI